MSIKDSNGDTHLLFGLLAFQNDLISRRQLLSAFGAWIADKSRRIDELLIEQQALSRQDHELLARLVELHMQRNGLDATQSLARLGGLSSIHTELSVLAGADQDALRSLSLLPSASSGDPSASSGEARSARNRLPNAKAIPLDGRRRFRIIRHHAQGGLGVVYLAEDLDLHREVALKQIREDRIESNDFCAKFTLEAEVTGKLEHPGIVPVYALGTDERGRPYYAMRFIKGEDLRSKIQSFHASRKLCHTPLDGPELRALLRRFIDVCNAVDYAHHRGVLHRDLKPGNIMLGKYGETLVVDWGLAKPLAPEQKHDPQETLDSNREHPVTASDQASGSETRYGTLIGTPAYAPPEQVLGQLERLCPASDCYALGVILYEMLTGKVPFSGDSIDEVVSKVVLGNMPLPRNIDHQVPSPLEAICLKAMSVRIEDRYATAAELKSEIEHWLDDEAVACYPEPAFVKLQRWVRKNPALSASLAAALIVGLIGAVVFGFASSKHNQELRAKQSELANSNAAILEKSYSLRLANAKSFLATGVLAFDEGQVDRGAQLLLSAFAISDHDPSFHAAVKRIAMDRLSLGSSSLTPPRLSTEVLSFAFSPDGGRYVTGARDGAIRCFETLTGQPLGLPAGGPVELITFSKNGKMLITTDRLDSQGYSLCQFWDAFNLNAVGNPLRIAGHVNHVAMSPDGDKIITSSEFASRSELRLWERSSLKNLGPSISIQPFYREFNLSIQSQFNDDGTRFDVIDKNGYRLFDADTCELILEHPFATKSLEPDGFESQMFFSPNGQLLARLSGPANSYETKLQIWDYSSAENPKKLGDIDFENIDSMALHPNGQRLAVCTWDQEDEMALKFFELPTLNPSGELTGLSIDAFQPKFSPDGRSVALIAMNFDKGVEVWKIAAAKKIALPANKVLSLPREFLGRVVFEYSPDGSRLMPGHAAYTHLVSEISHDLTHVSRPVLEPYRSIDSIRNQLATIDGTRVKLWDIETGALLRELHSDTRVIAVAFSPDGRLLSVSDLDQVVTVYETLSGNPLGKPLLHSELVGQMVFNSDGTRLATASLSQFDRRSVLDEPLDATNDPSTEELRLWDPRSGDPVGPSVLRTGEKPHPIAFSPNGKTIAVAAENGIANIWNASDGTLLGRDIGSADERVSSIAYTPDGALLMCVIGLDSVTAVNRAEIRFFDTTSGEESGSRMLLSDFRSSATCSPNGYRLATWSRNARASTVMLWDANTRQIVGGPLRHDAPIEWAMFSSDGSKIATVSEDRTIRLWDGMTGNSIGSAIHHSGRVACLAFSSNGQQLASCDSHSAQIWDTDTGVSLGMPMDLDDAALAISFASSDRRLVVDTVNDTYVWDVEPCEPPANDSSAQTFFELRAHFKVDADGQTLPLTLADEDQRHKLLEHEASFWAKNRSLLGQRQTRWHMQQAQEALNDQDLFATEFHLGYLKNTPRETSARMTESVELRISYLESQKKRVSEVERLLAASNDAVALTNFSAAAHQIREARLLLGDSMTKQKVECTQLLVAALLSDGTESSLLEARDLLLGPDTNHHAIEHWTSALAENWNLEFAVWLIRAKREELPIALAFANTHLSRAELDGDSEFTRYWKSTIGWIQAQSGQHESATKALAGAAERETHDFMDLMFYAIALRDAGDKVKAAAMLEQSIAKFHEVWESPKSLMGRSWRDQVCLDILRQYIQEQQASL